MEFKKLNKVVSYYSSPSLGKIDGSQRMMALSVDKTTSNPYFGIARKITQSTGSVDVPGFVDESKLVLVESGNALSWNERGELRIKGIQKVIDKISGKDKYFIGLEDPDIWIDDSGRKHVYFTIAFKLKERLGYKVYLGHAQGNSLDNLIATAPILGPIGKEVDGFKEASISPIVTNKGRLNLNEFLLWDIYEGVSAISVSLAKDMSKPWKYLRTAFDPRKTDYSWIAGHASPCAILPKDFVSRKDLLVCIVNGREKTKTVSGQRVYGKFRPGLVLFNPRTGEIPWVSSEPLFEDIDARTITFASDFLRTDDKEGILYAHVNDSFVRAYKLNALELLKLLPKDL